MYKNSRTTFTIQGSPTLISSITPQFSHLTTCYQHDRPGLCNQVKDNGAANLSSKSGQCFAGGIVLELLPAFWYTVCTREFGAYLSPFVFSMSGLNVLVLGQRHRNRAARRRSSRLIWRASSAPAGQGGGMARGPSPAVLFEAFGAWLQRCCIWRISILT